MEILLGHATFLRAHAPTLIVLRGVGLEPPAPLDPSAPPPVALRGALRGWFERANAAGHLAVAAPAAVAEALLGAMEGRAFNRYLGGEDFAPGRDEDVVRALVEALVPPPPRTAGAA
ncbi:MAG: TetR/AcrR family transcriptional regulator C-terminal domain-containing protein [Pseudomonadota bacterium]